PLLPPLLQYELMNVSARYQPRGRTARDIAVSVEAAVDAGQLLPGAALATVRSLAEELGVSPTTVAAAYRTLRQRGIVAGHGRRGTRVCARPPLPADPSDVLPPGARDLASGNPDPALLPDLGPALGRVPRRAGLYGEPPQLEALPDQARARDLGAVLGRHAGVLTIEDDHAGAVSGAQAFSLAGAVERWAVVRSTSKWLGPDLRLAVVAADPTTAARVEGRQRLGAGWVSHLLQHLVADLWSRRSTATLLARATRVYARRRVALLEALSGRGVEATGGSGLNIWVPVSEEQPVVAGLLARGWAVAAGERFRLGTPPAIRITAATL